MKKLLFISFALCILFIKDAYCQPGETNGDLWAPGDMNFTIDDNNNENENSFRWYKNGGNSNSQVMLEMRQYSTSNLFSFYGPNGITSPGLPPSLVFRQESNSTSISSYGTQGGLEIRDGGYSSKIQLGDGDDKVGIGTSSPSLKFDVRSSGQTKFGFANSSAWDHLYFTHDGWKAIVRAGGAEHGFDFQMETTPTATGAYKDDSDYSSKFQIFRDKVETKTPKVTLNYGTSTDTVKVSINTDAKVRNTALTVAGAVYIGPQAEKASSGNLTKYKDEYLADYNLWVEDGIVTEDLAFAHPNDWRDEVFEEDYDLISLEEVERFIKEHKHLPEVPSENEIKANGYKAHQMNLIFIQKIEELTLYTIELDKQVKELEAKLATLKSSKR